MVLLTRREVRREATRIRREQRSGVARAPDAEDAALMRVERPVRMAIGVKRWDIGFVVSSGWGSDGAMYADALSGLGDAAGLRCQSIVLPADRSDAADYRDVVADVRALLVVCPEGRTPGGRHLWWTMGHAAALRTRVALMPIARRDPWRQWWPVPAGLAGFPQAGLAHSVGEGEAEFWLVPSEATLDSRDAINLDYWLRMRERWP